MPSGTLDDNSYIISVCAYKCIGPGSVVLYWIKDCGTLSVSWLKVIKRLLSIIIYAVGYKLHQ